MDKENFFLVDYLREFLWIKCKDWVHYILKSSLISVHYEFFALGPDSQIQI